MYRDNVADFCMAPEDIDEKYIASAKAIVISGTALAQSPSREACLKAMMLAKRTMFALFLILITENTLGNQKTKLLFTTALLLKMQISLWVQEKNLI